MADLDPGRWATALLNRLGVQPTPANTRALVGWAQAEGGHWKNNASFNPLNTTQSAAGATNTGTQGNIKAYRDWNQGLQATARTLRNGRYGAILQALQGSDPAAVARAIGRSPWGTNASLVAKTISGAPAAQSVSLAAPRRTTTSPASAGGTTATQQALIARFLTEKNANPVDLALGLRALKDTAGRTVPDTTSSSAGSVRRSAAKGGPVVDELFYDPMGGWKNGQSIGAIGGHSDHVHVGVRSHGAAVAIARHAQKMGLAVRELEPFDKVDPVHTQNSEHYQGRAFDASGDPAMKAALVRWIQKRYGLKP